MGYCKRQCGRNTVTHHAIERVRWSQYADFERARKVSNVLGEKGDILLFGGGKKGEAASIFNETAHAIAILAFCPGGIDIFGSHFDAKEA